MANRRCLQTLTTRLCTTSLHSNQSLQSQHQTINPNNLHSLIPQSQFQFESPTPKFPPSPPPHISPNFNFSISRHFSSNQRGDDGDGSEDDDDEDDDEEDWSDDGGEENVRSVDRVYTAAEKESEAAEIGYKVIGRLEGSETDGVFKEYEPVFAVIQIGSHQFKVSNGDYIYAEKLKFCDVHDKIVLNKVLMLGSKTQTMIGRPILPDAAVHAVVEEHALDAKVIIFKKKRRKNYRRKNGHRQELTRLRITDIQGIEKPEKTISLKTEKPAAKKAQKVAVPA